MLDYLEIGKKEGTVLNGGHAIETPEGGYYIAPTVIADVAPTARIALEEIFGPVLAVIKSHNFDDALAIANNTEYGLTGAIYTSSREKLIARAKSSTSATSTSTASAPEPWSERIPSAAST